METLWQDARYGFRMLAKRPGFTIAAVLSLALGIGANTAIFSLVNAVLLRPLPFPQPDRLAMVWEDASSIGFPRNTPAPANYVDWKTQTRTFEDMAAVFNQSYNLTGTGEPEKIEAYGVTANFLSLLGVRPALGRDFLPEEDTPDANRVALISHGLWQRRLGGDPGVTGSEILLDDRKHTVIGVMPAGFQFLDPEIDLWVPARLTKEALARRTSHYLQVVGRMKPGVTLEQAQSDIGAIMEKIRQDHPNETHDLGSLVIPLHEMLAGDVRLALIVLLVAVGCVLLIACANIANLLLARATARRREIAVRTAMGASRLRLIRQLLTESLLLAVLGGVAGIGLAYLSFDFLKQMVPDSMAGATKLGIDIQVFGYALLLSVVTGLIFGLAPALQAAKLDLNEVLKQSGGRAGAGSGGRLRNFLVVAEVALAVMLLVGAGLLIKTFIRLRGLDVGLSSDNVLTMRTVLPRNRYPDAAKRAIFYQQVLERVRALPAVEAVGYTTAVPLTWRGGTNGFTIEGRTPEPNQDANHRQISPDYFQTMKIPLRAGRYFTDQDGPKSLAVAMINETMARQFWPGESPIEKRFKLGGPSSELPWLTVVGVVGDVKQMGLEAPVKAEMYFPYQQITTQPFFAPRDLVIRTKGDPMKLVAAARQEVWAVDAQQPVSDIKLMDDILATEVAPRRLGMTLLTAFSALALGLASLGIYGVLSYTVTQRTQEIGVRMALGARPGDVLRMVMIYGMKLGVGGILIGVGASLLLTRWMSSILFGVSATDPMTFIVIPLLLGAVAGVASYLPARRAMKVDPMVALRYE
jgi:putative ABC transport system permease protein